MIIKNARLLSELTENYSNPYGNIKIVKDRIIKITAEELVPEPGETVVDAENRTVLPGLIDMHLHFAVSGGDMHADNAKPLPYRTLEVYEFATKTLNAGFTTVRDVGDVDYMVLALRNFINEGRIQGPRIQGSGKILTPTESGNSYFQGMYDECDSPDEVRAAARRQFSNGADFIKVMASGAISNPGGDPGVTIESEAELREMVACAKLRNTYVAAHCHGTDSMLLAIKSGVRTIEHATFMSDEVIEELKKETAYIVPTLVCNATSRDTEEAFAEFMNKKKVGIIEKRNLYLKKAYEAGLRMGFGTDEGTTNNWHGLNADEFVERYEQIGMKPIDILKQATVESAYIMNMLDDVGTIKEGKYADFVIVDGNPDEDIYLMTKGIVTVIKGGEIIRNSILYCED